VERKRGESWDCFCESAVLQICRSRILQKRGGGAVERRGGEEERDREEVKSLGKSWNYFCETGSAERCLLQKRRGESEEEGE
jgi:hypothetical protein